MLPCINRVSHVTRNTNIILELTLPVPCLAGGLTETMMLQKLLGKTSNENVPNSCRLHRLPNGHSVVLSVHLTADHYTATISTKDVCTLVLMRTAIMDRIQVQL